MTQVVESTFREHVANGLRREANTIGTDTMRQVQQQLAKPVAEAGERVFPEDALRDVLPRLVRAIAGALEQGEPVGDPSLLHELHRLARLRRSQGFTLDEVATDFELLFERVHEAVQDVARSWSAEAPLDEVLDVAHRLGRIQLDLQRTVRRAWSEPHPWGALERAQVLNRFGRTLNHELRNHVYALQMQVRLLREPRILADDARRTQLLERLKEGLGRLSSATTDTLNEFLAGEDRGHEILAPLSTVVEELWRDLARHAERHQVTLRAVGPLPDVQVPAARIQLALLNTVGHAIRRATAGTAVSLEATTDAEGLELTVVDEGPALAPEELEQLMVLDTEVGPITDQRLGIWAVRELLRPLGGDITLGCTDGRCTHHLRVPQRSAEDPAGG